MWFFFEFLLYHSKLLLATIYPKKIDSTPWKLANFCSRLNYWYRKTLESVWLKRQVKHNINWIIFFSVLWYFLRVGQLRLRTESEKVSSRIGQEKDKLKLRILEESSDLGKRSYKYPIVQYLYRLSRVHDKKIRLIFSSLMFSLQFGQPKHRYRPTGVHPCLLWNLYVKFNLKTGQQ